MPDIRHCITPDSIVSVGFREQQAIIGTTVGIFTLSEWDSLLLVNQKDLPSFALHPKAARAVQAAEEYTLTVFGQAAPV